MTVKQYELILDTAGDTDIIDITPPVMDKLHTSGVKNGVVVVFVPGSTAAVTTIEHESGVLNDLARAVERLVPRQMEYEHDRRWGDGNGYSHVRAALLGPSLSVPVADGRPMLGTWQQIVLMDFDARPRQRRVIVQILGQTIGEEAVL